MVEENDDPGLSAQQLLHALLLLAIAERDERSAPDSARRRTEVLLSEAGFSIGDVAKLTGRPYESVKSTIRRSKQKR